MKKLLLNGIWKLEGGGYSCEGEIPGSVYSILLNNGLIEDPYYRMNELGAYELSRKDFTFSRHFAYEPTGTNKVLLCCDGLDTLCDIYLNGNFVEHTDNMHRSYELDISSYIKNGENFIELRFFSPVNYALKKYDEDPLWATSDALDGISHLRKAHCMFGWDWGPRLPDEGIWKDIYLLEVNSDRILDVELIQRHEDQRVFLTPKVTTERGEGNVIITLITPDGKKARIAANTENEVISPELWWPHGYGKQPLYRVKVELTEQGAVVDSCEKRIGLRELKLIREKDRYGESFCHEVNGIRIFAMGADYIPEDNILSRCNEERTRKLLECCVNSNFNTVRVWGGGIYPFDYFFDICDELGLLVFEDLMFACIEFPSTEEFRANIGPEIRQNLMRMRHHACIAVISGNNEIEESVSYPWWSDEKRQIYIDISEGFIADIVSDVCPYIPYISSSPTSCGHCIDPKNENYGDSHYWAVWHENKPFAEYRNHHFRYLSEFGFQSFPCEKTVNAFTLPEERNIFSRTMEMHQRNGNANAKILTYLSQTFKYPHSFGTLLFASQLLQAEAIRYGVEHFRRNRGRCMGALYWQLNDIWPVASWASIDYYGRYKALQYVAKRFFAPVMISCAEKGERTTRPDVNIQPQRADYTTEAQLAVANETLEEVSGRVVWELRCADGKIIREGSADVTVPALSSVWLDNIDFNKTDVNNTYMSFALLVEGKEISSGTVLFTTPKYFNFLDPKLNCEIKDGEITIYADAYAKYVQIDSCDSDFVLEDNYFDMNAGKRTVKIIEGTPKTVQLRSVYDIK